MRERSATADNGLVAVTMGPSGWRPSGFDDRDYRWSGGKGSSRQVSLPLPFGPRNQGDANCCVAVAIATSMEILDASRGNVRRLSPLFNYYLSRRNPKYTGLVAIRDGMSSAVKRGICWAEEHEGAAGPDGPYDRADALAHPSSSAYASARKNRILDYESETNRMGYFRLDRPGRSEAWREALYNGSPIVFGFYTTSAYQRLTEGPPYAIQDVADNFGSSGHAAVVYGCNGKWFRVQDSRGSGFADSGTWALHENVVDESWVAESWAVVAISYDT